MTQEKLSVRKIREILRLKYEVGLSNRAIARACCISNSTVGDYVVRARRAGLVWPVAEEQSEGELYQQLFPEVKKPKLVERPQPNWEKVYQDLARQGVTLQLLWQEYRDEYPDGYGYTQFRAYYQRWNQAHTTSMRLPHKGGELLEVDYAGMTLPITNPDTGDLNSNENTYSFVPNGQIIMIQHCKLMEQFVPPLLEH